MNNSIFGETWSPSARLERYIASLDQFMTSACVNHSKSTLQSLLHVKRNFMAHMFVSTCVFLSNRGGGLGGLPYHYQPSSSFACLCLCLRLSVCPREGAGAQLMYVQSSPSSPHVCVLFSPKEGCCHISQDHPLLKLQVAATQGRWVCKNGQFLPFPVFVFVFCPKE